MGHRPARARTDGTLVWPQIVALYGLLERLSPGPMVALNRAVAVAMVDGLRAGLALLETLANDGRLARHHRLAAVRVHLLEMTGDRSAARRTNTLPERRYLEGRATRLADGER
jgi:predicted RNA polymerase sigma factor